MQGKRKSVEGFFQGTALTAAQEKAFGKKAVEVVDNNGSQALVVRGYASTSDQDRYGDVVDPNAFTNSIDRFKENGIILLQHKHDKPIGKPMEGTRIEKDWLFLEAMITEDVDGVFSAIKNGVLKGFSIGFRIMPGGYEWKEVEVDGNIDYVCIIKEIDLYEVSVVSVPANPYTFMKSIKKSLEETRDESPANAGTKGEALTVEAPEETPVEPAEAVETEETPDGDENPSETGDEAENAEVEAATVAEAVTNPEEEVGEKSVETEKKSETELRVVLDPAQVKAIEESFEKKIEALESANAEAVKALTERIKSQDETIAVIVKALKDERRSVGLAYSEAPTAHKAAANPIARAISKAQA